MFSDKRKAIKRKAIITELLAKQQKTDKEQKSSPLNSNENFRFFEKMPPKLLPGITQFQTVRERLTINPLISKYFNENSKNPLAWNYTGAIDYNNFVHRMQALPRNLQQLILSETEPYDLIFAERVAFTLALPVEGRIQSLFSPEQVALFKHPLIVEHLCRNYNNLVIAVLEGLIAPEQVADFYTTSLEVLFKNYNGCVALREGLITLQQVADLSYPALIEPLLTPRGILALQNGFDFADFDGSFVELKEAIEDHLSQHVRAEF